MELFPQAVEKKSAGPQFPDCESLRAFVASNQVYWLCVEDVLHALDYTPARATLEKKIKEAGKVVTVEMKTLSHVWQQEWLELDTSDPFQRCVSHQQLKKFALWAVKRMRRSKTEKIRLCRKLGVEFDEVERDKIKVPIEEELLADLEQACPFQIKRQYCVDRYRLDAYLPRIRLGIEIDENGHRGYKVDEEREKETTLRDHNIVLIRYNPHENQGQAARPSLRLIRQVWERVSSPDFVAFRDKWQLK